VRARHWMPALALFLIAAAPGGLMFFESGPDRVIFPPQVMNVRFDHALHVRPADSAKGIKGAAQDCTDCHTKIDSAASSAERDIPGHDECTNCHDVENTTPTAPGETVKETCDFCHLRPSVGTSTVIQPIDIPDPNIKFAHQAHVKAKVECTTCHVDVPKKEIATRDDYPTMDRCIDCHQEKKVSTECKTCHYTETNGKLQTHYSSGVLKPKRLHVSAIHSGDFLRQHAVPAQRDKAYCNQCHTQNDCLQCHDGVGRDARYHPGDWISTHPLRAKKDDFRCESCHNFQQFCLNCHVRSGVATVTELGGTSARRTVRVDSLGVATGPHPMAADGWTDKNSKNFHGAFAQRNIKSCVSCHQEQFCLTCHASGFNPKNPTAPKGMLQGGNPHPPGFSGKTASARTARACLKCHHPADPSWRQ
jgi:hypothetical protein